MSESFSHWFRANHPLLQDAKEILAKLIAFDTVSRNSNLELISWVEEICQNAGAQTKRIPSDDGQKTNLIATFGPDIDGGIILSGHSDVVPIDGQDWHSNPFELLENDGKYFGRGTCDMKGFSACVLAVLPKYAKALIKPVHYALSYDEEVGCIGAPRMVDKIAKDYKKISGVIVGEPTDMKIVSAHKSIHSFYVEIEGKEAHSSRTDQGVSAVMAAIPLLEYLRKLGDELGNVQSIFTPSGSTITVGLIEGGTAVNILARHCQFIFDIRTEPDFDIENLVTQISREVEKIDAQIKAKAPEGYAKLLRRSSSPGLRIEENSFAEQISRQITGDNDIEVVSYGTEAGLFQNANMPAIICGPGSILQAHQPDEFVEISQISACLGFLETLMQKLS